jgi:hypothetical protein
MAKVWKVPGNATFNLVKTPKPYQPKRFYSLFVKLDKGCKRVSNLSCDSPESALKLFGAEIGKRIAIDAHKLVIRPVSIELKAAEGIKHFSRPSYNDYKYDRANWIYR